MKKMPPCFDISVLYVEDDDNTRIECEQVLRRWVRTLLVASDGSAGLELFRQHQPDLVITDICMPIMDGLQMAMAIRELAPEVRIISITALTECSHLMEAIKAGIDHFVLKPIDIIRLNTIVRRCSLDIIAQKAIALLHGDHKKVLGSLQHTLDDLKLYEKKFKVFYNG